MVLSNRGDKVKGEINDGKCMAWERKALIKKLGLITMNEKNRSIE